MQLTLTWIKCQGDVWCKLDSVNLEHPHFDNLYGVYIIWHGGSTPATVYVGQGNIRERLYYHRTNKEIQKYKALGLYVTWAYVPQADLNGVENYLFNRLNPKVGSFTPDALPIEVNFPW